MPNYQLGSFRGSFLLTGQTANFLRLPGDPTTDLQGQSVRVAYQGTYVPVWITGTLATTQVVNLCNVRYGHIYIPSGGPTTLAPYCSPDPTGVLFPFLTYYNKSNAVVTWTMTAAHPCEFPDTVWGMSFTKFVRTAGSDGLVYFFIKG